MIKHTLTIFEKLPMSPKKSVGEFEIRGGGEGVKKPLLGFLALPNLPVTKKLSLSSDIVLFIDDIIANHSKLVSYSK